MPVFGMMVVTCFATFFFTWLNIDTYASNYNKANEACQTHASGSGVYSWDIEVATCSNGVTLYYKEQK